MSYRTDGMDWTGPRRTLGILGGVLLFASPVLGLIWEPLWLIGWGIALTTIYFCISVLD